VFPCAHEGNSCVSQKMHVLPKGMVVFFKEMFVFLMRMYVLLEKMVVFSREMLMFSQGNDCVHKEMFAVPMDQNSCASQGGMFMFLGKCLCSLRNVFPKNKCIDSLRKWYKCS